MTGFGIDRLARRMQREAAALAVPTLPEDAPPPPPPVDFARVCGIEPDPWQAAVLTSVARKLLLNCSRQSGKSTTCGILGLHTAGFHPETLVLVVSPSQKQSGELHRTITSLYETARANGAALPDVEQSSALRTEFTNGSRIVALPGSEATVRGYPAASLVLIDEASRVTDELVAAIQPTLATTNGRLIALSTPCGKRGFFWREWNGGIGWERTEVPVTDCPRIEQSFLDDQRHQLGEWTYGQEYLCQFYDAETSVFSSDLITRALSDAFEPFLSSAR